MSAVREALSPIPAVADTGWLPLPMNTMEQHAALPTLEHDERVRYQVAAGMNTFLAQRLLPAVQRAAVERVEPALEASLGRPAADRHEYRRGLERDLTWQLWSRLRRSNMEMVQQAARLTTLRQLPDLVATCRALNAGHDRLTLEPSLQPPGYLARLHSHLMPGGYVTDLGEDDVAAGATYELGVYAVLGGKSGPASDRAGRATVAWLQEHRPGWQPKRILDLGCGIGANTAAIARAFPDAEVVGVEAGAAMVRYGAARAASLGIDNLRFVQGDVEQPPLGDEKFDLVVSLMVLHETSRAALGRIFETSQRHLAQGGLTFHLEQPPYRDKPLIEQCLRDWDGRYNNEAFWSSMHETDLAEALRRAGFAPDHVQETEANAPQVGAKPGSQEDYGRGGAWYVVTGEKPRLEQVRA